MSKPSEPGILQVPEARREREARRALEIQEANRSTERTGRRVLAQCIALAFLGAPIYAWSWHETDPDKAPIWVALAFAVSYAAPFFRWLIHHMKTSDEFTL